MYTEDEAKTKWCPESRVVLGGPGEGGVSGNAFEDCEGSKAYASSRCIGSGCMMWRWGQPENVAFDASAKDTDPEFLPYPPYGPWEWHAGAGMWRSAEGPERGYCGLVGEPS